MSFSDFNLKEDFISSIEAAGYQSPTPLQSQLIPLVAQRKSALVWTQSASGKTGAFLIPAINYILENPAPEKRGARILILTSRRDRVSQINYTIKRLSSDHVMRFGFIVSGRPYQTQMRLMRRPLDIMIATPGRLNDLMNNGKADFSQLEMLIIDDLTSIYRKNLHGLVEKIIEQAGDSCSSISFVRGDDEITPYARSLFSDVTEITIENEHENEGVDSVEVVNQNNKQVEEQLVDKKSLAKNKQVAPESPLIIEKLMPQNVYVADDYTHKIAMMDHLMDEFAGESTIVYVSTSKAAKMLNENLANHGHAAELVQDLNSEEIDGCDILICSDQDSTALSEEQAASNDKHIIHFDLPRKTEQYLKRMNQHTQERDEAALLMVDGYNFNELKHIEKTIGEKIEQVNVPGLEPLKPFVNLNKSKPAHKQRNNSRNGKPNKNKRTKPNKNSQSRNKSNNRKKQQPQSNSVNASSNNNSTNTKQRRQRKGAFGRLNGGANRKTTGEKVANAGGRHSNNTGRKYPKVGVSSRGTGAPAGDRGWQSDFAAPKERQAESKNVVIRYSKKRTIASPDKDSDDV